MAPLLHGQQPHALAVPIPFQGHIHPLLALSKKLTSAGIMVTFANTHTNHQRITAQHPDTDRTATLGGDVDDDLLQFVSLGQDLNLEGDNAVDTLLRIMTPAMKAAVARLFERLNATGPSVSLFLFDFRLTCVLDLAIAAGLPSLSLWTQNAANFACNAVVSQGFRTPPDDSKLFMCARGVPPITRKELTGLFIESTLPPLAADEYAWAPFRRSNEPTWIVLNTFEELEATTLETLEEILGFRPLALGPLVNAPSFSISKEITMTSIISQVEWLQRHPNASVLYIAFGTLAGLSQVQLEELVLGLEISRQPFMWVFRKDLCVHSKDFTLESLSERFRNQGLVVPWTPQKQVLSHPSVGGFLTHCGWNSSIEGIVSGVPMLTWPLFVDQFLNKRCLIEQWGVGLGFDADDNGLITRQEIDKKVSFLMRSGGGNLMREKAKELSNVAVSALGDGGSTQNQCNGLIEQIRKVHLKR